ncbi:H-type small acid-soluble spore protein [Alkalibacillus aidingensis]|uniref:H-type small acid-soluble spore protein n=1 Tax=Alkalibacillus aidingensis TaxID=2747607 RepID=UPI0016608400|nr:H-type small acid-soluble spore protein [Alkalibacillus aidingensis]
MESQRAQQIYEAPVLINVSYQGQPVFIQDVDLENNTATVSPLTDVEERQQVQVDDLVEEGPH